MMKNLLIILLLSISVISYSQVNTIKVQGVDTGAMLLPYKSIYPRQALSLTTTGSSGVATYNNVSGVLNIPNYGGVETFTPTAIPFASGAGTLTEDATGLFFNGTNVGVGHNDPNVLSGILINGSRAAIAADINGMLLQGGVSTTYDATKHFRFRNGSVSNPYLELYSVGSGPWVHYADFTTNIRSTLLQSGSTAPVTTGTTKFVINDSNGLLSFTDTVSRFSLSQNVFWTSGSGSPEGVVTASPGALYSNTDGGDNVTLYIKTSGVATNTGWRPVSTSAP